MKNCENHWSQIRTAIDERGLTKFVAADGKEAASRLLAQQRAGKFTPENFEPLLIAQGMIDRNALACGGSYLLTGPYCPLCELEKNKEYVNESPEEWIKNAADGTLKCAQEIGLVALQ